MKIWQQLLHALVEPGRRVVMVTVFDVTGSSPREQGARMLVLPDRTIGTIGGGMLEWDAINEARESLGGGNSRDSWRSDKLLGPDLEQCCGGGITLMFEVFSHNEFAEVQTLVNAENSGSLSTHCRFDEAGRLSREIVKVSDKIFSRLTAPMSTLEVHDSQSFNEYYQGCGIPLVLFGAGHVGKALVTALNPLPFDITWVDSRTDVFPAVLEGNSTSVVSENPHEILSQVAHDSLVVVMTHSHVLDFELVSTALHRPFPYIGLIGSKSKSARFRSKLKKLGLGPDTVNRLICPIGLLDIRGKQAAVIAASITAQLLALPADQSQDVAIPLAVGLT